MPRATLRSGSGDQERVQTQDEAAPAAPTSRALELQHAVGNRAVARMIAGGAPLQVARNGDGTTATLDPAKTTDSPPSPPVTAAATPAPDVVKTKEVDRAITETISHAPAAYSAWNSSFRWKAKWKLELDGRAEIGELRVIVRLHSTATDAVKSAWTSAITSKWSNKFAFVVLRDTPVALPGGGTDNELERYPIRICIQWVDADKDPHYTIAANAVGATTGGRAGKGGTTSMTGWGTVDTEDITHEFGHILGCPEEYFTTDGVDYTYGGTKRGFRDTGAGVMNDPAGPALARNFNTIRDEAEKLHGGGVKTEVRTA